MARLRAFELTGDPVFREEAMIAARTTGSALNAQMPGQYVNYSLCHGHFGNAELLLEAAASLGEQQMLDFTKALATRAAEAHERHRQPWPCGVMGAGETPGLMLGLAGIGHFFLRLHDPIAAPSLLRIGP